MIEIPTGAEPLRLDREFYGDRTTRVRLPNVDHVPGSGFADDAIANELTELLKEMLSRPQLGTQPGVIG